MSKITLFNGNIKNADYVPESLISVVDVAPPPEQYKYPSFASYLGWMEDGIMEKMANIKLVDGKTFWTLKRLYNFSFYLKFLVDRTNEDYESNLSYSLPENKKFTKSVYRKIFNYELIIKNMVRTLFKNLGLTDEEIDENKHGALLTFESDTQRVVRDTIYKNKIDMPKELVDIAVGYGRAPIYVYNSVHFFKDVIDKNIPNIEFDFGGKKSRKKSLRKTKKSRKKSLRKTRKSRKKSLRKTRKSR